MFSALKSIESGFIVIIILIAAAVRHFFDVDFFAVPVELFEVRFLFFSFNSSITLFSVITCPIDFFSKVRLVELFCI